MGVATSTRMTAEDIAAFVDQEFPQSRQMAACIEHIEAGRLRMRLPIGHDDLRPGGTVSGPTLMTLADTAMYFLVLAMCGPIALAVTTHLSIDFLRRPLPTDLIAEAELLKLGTRLAVGRVTMCSDGSTDVVAHAAVTYSIPPAAAPAREK